VKLHQIHNGRRLVAIKHSARETPHLTLETNRTCNMRCRSCYATDRTGVKPLDQVLRELDLGRSRRNLETVTLLGGEPTLHPDLARIVAEVKARGLVCQLLTNGLAFLAPGGVALLDRLVAAGVDRVIVHIDVGQGHVHEDPDGAADAIIERLDARGTHAARCITIYDDNRGTIPGLIARHGRHRHFDGVLAMIATDHPGGPATGKGELEEEHAALVAGLGIEPTAYVPSSLDDQHVSWLLYFFYRNARTGAVYPIPPATYRAYMRAYRRLTGRQLFGETARPALYPLAAGVVGVADLVRRPGRLGGLRELLRGASPARDLRLHHVVIQSPPELDPTRGEVHLCHQCPDATVRHGHLTPVCLADRIAPQDGSPVGPAEAALRRAVRRHLEEE
jgi:hypothetical protein